MNALLLRRGIKRGITTLSRERGWLTGALALTGVLTILQMIIVLLFVLQAATQLLTTGSALRLEVQRNTSNQSLQEFLVAVKDQPTVERSEYVTREQAYERERERAPDLVGFLEEFRIANPFPDTVLVTLKSVDDYDAFVAFVQQPEWSRVVNPSTLAALGEQEREVRDMRSLTTSLQSVATALSVLLFLVCIALIMEFVRRRAASRSDEILVERVSGVPAMSVLLPFVTESTIILLLACVLSAVIVGLVLLILPAAVPALGPGGILGVLRTQALGLILWASIPLAILELIALPALAFAGSWLALRK